MGKVSVVFGAMAQQLHEQLGVPRSVTKVHQRAADAVSYLAIHGVLSEAEAHRARTRLVTQLGAAITAHRKASN